MKTTNKIGFKSFDDEETPKIENNNNNNSLPTASNDRFANVSPAQANLIMEVETLSGMIINKTFSLTNEQQRTAIVIRLINSVALNTELTIKTSLLI